MNYKTFYLILRSQIFIQLFVFMRNDLETHETRIISDRN